MTYKCFIPLVLIIAVITSCQNSELSTPPTKPINHMFSLERKWYTNIDDDRYYISFSSDGNFDLRYYQHLSTSPSNLNSFITKNGSWKYLNTEHTKFSIGWEDSIDCYYTITNETSEKITIEKDISGPMGRGLENYVELYKYAKSISIQVPEEIAYLVGTWYYDANRSGKYLLIKNDGNCIYHHYQDFGSTSNLTGWVNTIGNWIYNTSNKELVITMSGEISYHYHIDKLSIDRLTLSGTTSSMITNTGTFYKYFKKKT